MKKLIYFTIIGMFFISGCATTGKVPDTFWQQKGCKIGIVILPYPKARKHSQTQSYLTSTPEADKNVNLFLENYKYDNFNQLLINIGIRLQEKGFMVKKISGVSKLGKLNDFEAQNHKSNYAKRDFRPIAEKENIDYLLIFDVAYAGMYIQENSLIILTPYAVCSAYGLLLDLTDNRILWEKQMRQDTSSIYIKGKWNDPPDYPALKEALDTACDNAAECIENYFFNDKPYKDSPW